MKPTKKLIALAITSLASITTFAAGSSIEADTIFYGGPVVTVDVKNPQVTALAVKDGKILAVGNQASIILDHAGKETKLVDLKGSTLMPGFVEPHVHISSTAVTENVALNLSNFALPYDTIETLLDKIRAHKNTLPEGAWILGFGVDPSRTDPFMAELTADQLDKVSTTNPIFIVNQSLHIAYVNHKALEMAGINENTPNPGGGGMYVRDAQGKLTGVLVEPASYTAFARKMTPPDQKVIVEAYMKTVNSMAAAGITTAAEMGMGSLIPMDAEYAMIKNLSHQPDFPLRVRAYMWGAALKEGTSKLKPNEGDDRFRVIGVKYIGDGSTQGLTAALNKPYAYPAGTSNLGELDWEDEKLYEAAKPFFDQGWQISIHANGDRAIEQAINVHEKLLKNEADPAKRRLRIEHFTVASDDAVDRVQKLGLAPSMTIGHVGFWGEAFHNHILGNERASHIDPTGSLARRKVRFSLHSDSPVSPFAPLQYISTGASRLWQKPPRKVLGEQQRLAVDQAIKAVTLDAAYATFVDDKVGSLEPGKMADLVILNQNPRTTNLDAIPKIKVQETWIDGKRVYSASGKPSSSE